MLIAEGRSLRPNDFVGDVAQSISHSSESCPFCRGNEDQTPPELATVLDAEGNWQVRVVPNKYPVVSMMACGGREPSAYLPAHAANAGDLRPPLAKEAPHGIHEVIIESPRHIYDWTELSPDELATVLRVFRDRIKDAYATHQIKSALIFKNVGEAAGASLEHVHSQLIALPFAPEVLDTELAVAAEYHQEHGQCLMCRLLSDEVQDGTRLVARNSHFAAICVYAGRQPYETWIVPNEHQHDFTQLSDEQSKELAVILQHVLRRFSKLNDLPQLPAYNAVLHTAPSSGVLAAEFHWHWEIIPRSTSLAGFEWGTGMHINPVSPERAAFQLRSSNSSENLPIQ